MSSSLKFVDHIRLLKSLLLNLPTLASSPYWQREKMEAYQLRLLKARLADAKSKVVHYQQANLPDPSTIQCLSDWAKVPVLTKEQLLSRPINERINKDFAVGDLIEVKSSGSTGVPMAIYYDRKCFYYHMMVELRFFMMAFNYLPWHKQTYIYTNQHAYNSFIGLFQRKFIATLTPIEEILAQLRKNPPDILVSYPSSLRAIIDQMTPEDLLHIRPKAIGVNSEMSSHAERNYISEKMGTFVFDDYSSEELIWIASQCREKQYHIFDDINYIEILDDNNNPVPDGVVGNIAGSNLHNRGMPFLRYLQGDRGSIRNSTCKCGRKFKVLEKLDGRKNDAFILPDGSLLSPGYLLDLTDSIFFKYSQAVQAFRLIQAQIDNWILEIVPGQEWHASLESKISVNFSNLISQPLIKISLKVVNEIKRSGSGKFIPIISNVMREKLKSKS